jgi:hypothetical protein
LPSVASGASEQGSIDGVQRWCGGGGCLIELGLVGIWERKPKRIGSER